MDGIWYCACCKRRITSDEVVGYSQHRECGLTAYLVSDRRAIALIEDILDMYHQSVRRAGESMPLGPNGWWNKSHRQTLEKMLYMTVRQFKEVIQDEQADGAVE